MSSSKLQRRSIKRSEIETPAGVSHLIDTFIACYERMPSVDEARMFHVEHQHMKLWTHPRVRPRRIGSGKALREERP